MISENRRLRAEVGRLEAEKARLKEANRKLAEQGAEMDRRLAVREIAEGFAGEAAGSASRERHDKKIARARVNRLLREVDKCIALLNRGPE